MQHSHESAEGNVGKELLSLETIIARLSKAAKEAPSRYPKVADELSKRNSGWNTSKRLDRLKAFSVCMEAYSLLRFSDVKVTDLHQAYILIGISKPKLRHYQAFYRFWKRGPASSTDYQTVEESILTYLCDKPRGQGQKISLRVHEMIFAAYKDKRKFNYVQIARYLNDLLNTKLNELGNDDFFCLYQIRATEKHRSEIQNIKFISVSNVKRVLAQNPDIKEALDLERYGASAWRMNNTPLMRVSGHYPLDRVELDSTVVSIPYFHHQEGIRSGLTFCIATDTCTGAIIGYSVAMDGTAEKKASENAALYIKTIRNMVRGLYQLTGKYILPAELFADRFPGFNSQSIHDFVDELKGLDCRFNFERTGNPRAKARVESTIGRLMDEFKADPFFLGCNITARSKDSRKSPEAIAEITRKANLPTKHQVAAAIEQAIAQYNQRITKGQVLGRFKLFKNTDKPNARPMLHETYLWLFQESKDVTVRQGLIRFQIKGREYVYELAENLKPSLNGQLVCIRFDSEEVAHGEVIWVFDSKKKILLTECRPQKQPAVADVNKTDDDREIFRKHVARLKSKTKAAREKISALEPATREFANHLNSSKANIENIEDRDLIATMGGKSFGFYIGNGKQFYSIAGKTFEKSEAGVKELEPIIIDRLDVGMSQSDHNEDDDTGYMTISR